MSLRDMVSNLYCNSKDYNDLVMFILQNEVWNHPIFEDIEEKHRLSLNIRYIHTYGIDYDISLNGEHVDTWHVSFTSLVNSL